MSNIDKRALREIAEAAVSAHERLSVMPPDDIFDISLAEGTQLDADITALNALNSAANPTTVLALLDELEAKDNRAVEMPTFDGYVPHIARELQAAFRIACDNAGIKVSAGTDEGDRA
ncbi:hypothetical protein CEQ52_07510 [Enterobacter kobei]|uniref:ead/Ea22-like family protein n=1 Tax=Enterobacter kobei TaxID=208224 RepID=UPI000B4FF1ED|nr:ead/Ea22-like family protein [Enterobacter kobei]OWS96346.1 hypothetical protein CEQ52_07510 [Enterobacter kobei]